MAVTKAARKPAKVWFDWTPGPANDTEMLFYALLVLHAGEPIATLEDWAKRVLSEQPRYLELGDDWRPPMTTEWTTKGKLIASNFKPMYDAYNKTWPNAELEQIGVVIQGQRVCDGRCGELMPDHLRQQLNRKKGAPPRASAQLKEPASLATRNRGRCSSGQAPRPRTASTTQDGSAT